MKKKKNQTKLPSLEQKKKKKNSGDSAELWHVIYNKIQGKK